MASLAAVTPAMIGALPYACLRGLWGRGPCSICQICPCASGSASYGPTLGLSKLLRNGMEVLAWPEKQAQHCQQQLREAQGHLGRPHNARQQS